CWDIALGPLKQIPMNLFIMYMAGNTISIFPTMMVCMMAWRPIQALMAISANVRKFKPEVSSGFGLSHWEPDGFGIGCLQVPVHGTVTYTCIGLVSLH
ncbi:EMC4 isoform 13, partial [Pan troglodytes]